MKKILFFISSLNSGGAERVIVTLSNTLCKKYEVHILTILNTPSFYNLDSMVKWEKMNLPMPPQKGLKRKLLFPFINLKRIKYFINYVKKNNFDVVIPFIYAPTIIACIAKSFYKKFPLLVAERNDPTKKGKIFISLCHLADGIICQNEFSKNYYINQGFKVPITILPNPVNFVDIPKENTPIKRKEIVTVGRLTEQKNQALLIDAFSEIAKDYPQYALKIYGVGELENQLKTQIAALGLEKRVFLMGSKKRVMFEVEKGDIFVLPSNFEGFPNVLIEAMACGMPVISSDFPTGVARQLIKEGENGFLFPVGDKDALVKALKKMLFCPDKWGEMGQINRKIALNYTPEKVAEDWASTIKNMLDEVEK